MPNIKQVTLPSGTTYDLRDSRVDTLSGFTKYLGVTTTALTDGATTNPITINSQSVTAGAGDIVLYGNSEFIFDGTTWNAFGDLSALGTLAYKNSIAVSTTATGTVSKPTFSGSELESTGKFTPSGSNASSSVSGTCSVTPSGSISTGTGTANYTPAGSVSAPTISVASAGSTAKVTGITNVGSMPTFTVANEVLTITAGSTPTADTEKTFKTGDASYSASQPTFTGTGAQLKFTGSASSGTISGTAAAQTFSGTEGNVSVKGTPAGTVSQPTFSGNAVSGTVTYSPS